MNDSAGEEENLFPFRSGEEDVAQTLTMLPGESTLKSDEYLNLGKVPGRSLYTSLSTMKPK